MGSRSPDRSRSSRRRIRTTRPTCAPSATAWATRSTTRDCRSTRRCCSTSSATTAPRRTGRMADQRFALVVGRFYSDLAERLVAGARELLEPHGEVDVYDVPGAFELPLAAKYAAESGRYAGIVALGAVIRGETDHYDYVCGEAARGIQQVQLLSGVPVGFGVLTVDSMEQALARVKGGGKRDSGAHAAEAVLASLAIKDELGRRPRAAGFSVS